MTKTNQNLTDGQRLALLDDLTDTITVHYGSATCDNCDQPTRIYFTSDDSYDSFASGPCCTPIEDYVAI